MVVWQLLCSLAVVLVQGQKQPNILLLLADDLGYADVDWHDPKLSTPNLRKLAFSDHTTYLTNSYVNQLCTPTRSSLMTGYYPFRTGTQNGVFLHMEPAGVPLDFPFLPQNMNKLGYKSYLVGKWHLGYCKKAFLPTNRGFNYFYGYYGPQQGYFNHSADMFDRNSGKVVGGLDLFEEIDGHSIPVIDKNGVYSTDLFTDKTMKVLDQHPKNVPFFMFLSFQSVHAPLQAPAHYKKRCSKLFYDPRRQLYCGMLASMDDAVGRVINYLKARGLYENTVIIFSSDNGGDTKFGASNRPYKGEKNSIWEGGTKTVTIFHSQKYIRQFSYKHDLFHVVDWHPTLLGIGGATLPTYGDGLNQWPLILGKKDVIKRNQFIYNINHPISALRKGEFKLVYETKDIFRHDPTARAKLYKLTVDPLETTDLSKKYPLVVSELINKLKDYAKKGRNSVRKPVDARGNPSRYSNVYYGEWC
ncbi:unnamed protein product [Bursaphelenchus okinawaensis]|uniref:Sulfatase N-terminal domain-containing protein n=1 Tax=Bursaphelenchus okinawaensis TaxID=465554 RepID=A0A811K949_9BILA|nr:unnamed protein product [Bursaphelenchus okinawaensis]CAG9094605.1 unnamed protein product [Bursaphelenchus okinawaensis]